MRAIEPLTVPGPGIELVPMGEEFIDPMTAVLQDRAYSRFTTIPWPYERSMAKANVAATAGSWERGGCDWAIVGEGTGEFLGRIEMRPVPLIPDCLELGYFTAKDHWGQGVMTRAVALALDTAFTAMGATRVQWYGNEGNWGSWKAVWRNGLRREGVQRRAGRRLWAAGVLATDPREPDTPWDGPGAGAPAALDPGRPMGLVRQFHQTYSVPDRLAEHAAPTLDYERLGMRVALVSEEYAELIGAVYGPAARSLVEEAARAAEGADEGVRDVVEAADALADLVYVAYGMAVESGIDLDRVLAEVQASNLSKLMPDGTVRLRGDGKVLKGPGFFPPDVRRALGLGGGAG